MQWEVDSTKIISSWQTSLINQITFYQEFNKMHLLFVNKTSLKTYKLITFIMFEVWIFVYEKSDKLDV